MAELLSYHKPDPSEARPTELTAVASVQIAFGLLAVLGVILALIAGRLGINLGVLQLFAGIGLLRHRPGWRVCALGFIWFGMFAGVSVAVLAAWMATFSGGWNATGPLAQLDPMVAAAVMAAFGAAYLALHVWQYRVLTRPAVRAWFQRPIGDRVANEEAAANLAKMQGGPPQL